MAAIKRPRETRNGRFWMLIELKKSCIGESDAGNQTQDTATKPRNARIATDAAERWGSCSPPGVVGGGLRVGGAPPPGGSKGFGIGVWG